jgi:Tn3 transposase DDE domain
MEFTHPEEQEQEVGEGCKRLIKNAITCWNYLYLSQKISELIGPESAGDPIPGHRKRLGRVQAGY